MTIGGSQGHARADTTSLRSPLAVTSLERYARIVSRALDAPAAAVTFVKTDHQVLAGAVGISEEHQRDRVTPLTHSFCKHVVADREPLVVEDSREHPVLKTNLASIEDDVVAYAGWPVHDDTGEVLGALCAIDSEPRHWTPAQIALLRDLAEACSAELSERVRATASHQETERALQQAEHDRAVLRMSDTLGGVRTLAQFRDTILTVACDQLRCSGGAVWLLDDTYQVLEPIEDHSGSTSVVMVDADEEVAVAFRESTVRYTTASDVRAASAAADTGATPEGVVAYLPLAADGEVLGVLALTWPATLEVSAERRDLAVALTGYATRAARRVRAVTALEAASPGEPGVR